MSKKKFYITPKLHSDMGRLLSALYIESVLPIILSLRYMGKKESGRGGGVDCKKKTLLIVLLNRSFCW